MVAGLGGGGLCDLITSVRSSIPVIFVLILRGTACFRKYALETQAYFAWRKTFLKLSLMEVHVRMCSLYADNDTNNGGNTQ